MQTQKNSIKVEDLFSKINDKNKKKNNGDSLKEAFLSRKIEEFESIKKSIFNNKYTEFMKKFKDEKKEYNKEKVNEKSMKLLKHINNTYSIMSIILTIPTLILSFFAFLMSVLIIIAGKNMQLNMLMCSGSLLFLSTVVYHYCFSKNGFLEDLDTNIDKYGDKLINWVGKKFIDDDTMNFAKEAKIYSIYKKHMTDDEIHNQILASEISSLVENDSEYKNLNYHMRDHIAQKQLLLDVEAKIKEYRSKEEDIEFIKSILKVN